MSFILIRAMLSLFSRVRFFVTPWTAAHQAPLPMGFSRQEYWSGLPCPPPGDLPDPGIEPTSLTSLGSPAPVGSFFFGCFVFFLPLVLPGRSPCLFTQ